jgi:ABC-type sugar transport system ATPase subunit
LLSVVFVSSELEEVVAVSDRIIVLAASRSASHLGVEAFRSLALLQCMSPLLALSGPRWVPIDVRFLG